jgi:glucosamine--fructose-6-phosphate aminotransferase (isomerizing)
MCGIFAAISNKPVAKVLVEGLKRLEYRGYDSAGVVTLDDGALRKVCAVGKVEALESICESEPLTGHVGIAHTRWATHGAPSERNSHPHVADGVAVVHNGIVENHSEVRSELQKRGCRFASDTDSEVIPWLISTSVGQGAKPGHAIHALSERLSGSYAIAVLTERDPNTLYAKRSGSPLVAAIGPEGGYLSSDVSALAGFAAEAIVLDDGDQVELRFDSVAVYDRDGQPVTRSVVGVDDACGAADRGGFPHFMLKEIHEQPSVSAVIQHRYAVEALIAESIDVDFRHVDRLRLIACGTSYYACMVAKRWFAEVAGIAADVELGSEYRYAPDITNPPREFAVLVSQSGETADTLASLEKLKSQRIGTLGIVNQQVSTLAREADYFLPLLAGPEIGVASTKAFTAQLMVLAHLAAHMAEQRGYRLAATRFRSALAKVPKLLSAVLHNEAAIIAVAERFSQATSALFVGRGALYPLALEGALKMKEISYIHAEGYAAGELKHGPIALVDENTPVVALAPSGELFGKVASNIREIAARNGRITILGDRRAILAMSDVASHALTMPITDELIQPIVAAIPLQFLAYHVAVSRGYDVDRPRNLAKSVTVE